MKHLFKQFLFAKHCLVSDGEVSNTFQALFSLANLFGIKVVKGQHLVTGEHVQFAGEQLGEKVPPAFYRNFPTSVVQLSPDQLLFDQMVHYALTYGFGDFSTPGRSLFEKDFERTAFKENAPIKEFVVVEEAEGQKMLFSAVGDMLEGSRPLSTEQYKVVVECVKDYDYKIVNCASKNTLVKLIVDLRDVSLAKHLVLSDVLKVVEYLNFVRHQSTNVKKLKFCNADRKFLTQLLHFVLQNCHLNVTDCFQRRAVWCGFLHHIHFVAQTEGGKQFVNAMRSGKNLSEMSKFEQFMSQGDIESALSVLKNKGSGVVLRNLNYLLSRCQNPNDVQLVLSNLQTDNVILLLQLLFSYSTHKQQKVARKFKFVRFNMLVTHDETADEFARRKSYVTSQVAQQVVHCLKKQISRQLSNKLGKVYVDKNIHSMALPLQEGASMGGFGTLAKGSRVPIESGKKIRAFTYWEKVNDIDLSCMGICADGSFQEFSWRTMFDNQSPELAFSGDQTSGFDGGSEFFDVDVPLFKQKHPNVDYIVFCNNVFSGVGYDQIFCKAGYMLRDVQDSGEIFEPKTVQTSFVINCPSTYACLFAIDLNTNEMVWLNTALQSSSRVAGMNTFAFLSDYFVRNSIFNLGDMFQLMASQVVQSPDLADVIVSDNLADEREGKVVIHSYDFEKINALLQN